MRERPRDRRRASNAWLSRLAPALIAIAVTLTGCATETQRRYGSHPLARSKLWLQYTEMPSHKAFVLAGDPVGVWVAGMAGGSESVAEALSSATAECQRQRKSHRMKASCQPYARDAQVEWGRGPATQD